MVDWEPDPVDIRGDDSGDACGIDCHHLDCASAAVSEEGEAMTTNGGWILVRLSDGYVDFASFCRGETEPPHEASGWVWRRAVIHIDGQSTRDK